MPVYAPLIAISLHELIIKLRLVDARLELVEVVESKLVAVDFAVVSAAKGLLLRLLLRLRMRLRLVSTAISLAVIKVVAVVMAVAIVMVVVINLAKAMVIKAIIATAKATALVTMALDKPVSFTRVLRR